MKVLDIILTLFSYYFDHQIVELFYKTREKKIKKYLLIIRLSGRHGDVIRDDQIKGEQKKTTKIMRNDMIFLAR